MTAEACLPGEGGEGSFSGTRVEEKKQRKGPSLCGTQALGQALPTPNREKDRLQFLLLLDVYAPPLIFETILLGRNNYCSFADEKTEGRRG